MNARTHKCNICNRLFANKQALAQHKKDAHANSNRKNGRNRVRNVGPIRGIRDGGFDLNPSRIPRVPNTKSLTISGEDKVALWTFTASTTTIKSVDISTDISPRLKLISRAFQRIKFDSIEIIFTPQTSFNTSGGYVAGIVMDPGDRLVTANTLSATAGSVTKKFTETARMRMIPKPDLLYVVEGEDVRLSVPCTFWAVSEANPSVNVDVVVTILWRVTLSAPSVDPASTYVVANGSLKAKKNNYNLQYSKKGDGSDLIDDCTAMMPDWTRLDNDRKFFRVPTFTIEYDQSTTDDGTVAQYYVVYDPTDHKMYYSNDGRTIDQTTQTSDSKHVSFAVPCGTRMKYVGTGLGCSGVAIQSSTHHMSASETGQSSTPISTNYEQRFKRMETELSKLTHLLAERLRVPSFQPINSSPTSIDLSNYVLEE